MDERPKNGPIPWGALDRALAALEAARSDTREDGPVRALLDEAVHYLRRAGAKP